MKKSIWFLVIPGIVIAMTIAALWYSHLPIPVATSSMEIVKQEASSGSYRLVDTEKLSHLYQPDLDHILLVDTRQEWEHRAGHIAGSANFPMEPTWWARLINRGALKTVLGQDKKKTIVFY